MGTCTERTCSGAFEEEESSCHAESVVVTSDEHPGVDEVSGGHLLLCWQVV